MSHSKSSEELPDNIESVSSPETLSIWGLAWPSILANILFAAAGVVSIKAVGVLGTEAVAAVGTGQRILFVIQSIIMAVSTGTAALVARAFGSGNYKEASQVLLDSLWIGSALSLFASLSMWFYGESIISLFGFFVWSFFFTRDAYIDPFPCYPCHWSPLPLPLCTMRAARAGTNTRGR